MYFTEFFFFSFTSKPKKGIKFLQEKGIVGHSPQDVAKMLYNDNRLNKVQLKIDVHVDNCAQLKVNLNFINNFMYCVWIQSILH